MGFQKGYNLTCLFMCAHIYIFHLPLNPDSFELIHSYTFKIGTPSAKTHLSVIHHPVAIALPNCSPLDRWNQGLQGKLCSQFVSFPRESDRDLLSLPQLQPHKSLYFKNHKPWKMNLVFGLCYYRGEEKFVLYMEMLWRVGEIYLKLLTQKNSQLKWPWMPFLCPWAPHSFRQGWLLLWKWRLRRPNQPRPSCLWPLPPPTQECSYLFISFFCFLCRPQKLSAKVHLIIAFFKSIDPPQITSS